MVKQLTFENLRVNKTVVQSAKAGEKKKQVGIKRQQAKNIYNALKKGPLTTSELNSMARQYNTRIRELRQWLMEFGQTIDCIPQKGGNNRFEIVPFSGSKYQAELMARQRRSGGSRNCEDLKV